MLWVSEPNVARWPPCAEGWAQSDGKKGTAVLEKTTPPRDTGGETCCCCFRRPISASQQLGRSWRGGGGGGGTSSSSCHILQSFNPLVGGAAQLWSPASDSRTSSELWAGEGNTLQAAQCPWLKLHVSELQTETLEVVPVLQRLHQTSCPPEASSDLVSSRGFIRPRGLQRLHQTSGLRDFIKTGPWVNAAPENPTAKHRSWSQSSRIDTVLNVMNKKRATRRLGAPPPARLSLFFHKDECIVCPGVTRVKTLIASKCQEDGSRTPFPFVSQLVSHVLFIQTPASALDQQPSVSRDLESLHSSTSSVYVSSNKDEARLHLRTTCDLKTPERRSARGSCPTCVHENKGNLR
ncbi:unnamed protein product [Pleuronectes platessa]|uniref:Uncharacterized protein n=1 Tax=Pleuronectes platessa TaxID=8262 RepID=A0A9N7TWA3_PLEPL|nr:unnamed protein product [Pleuronectes platessa]